jgi:hypothetical protein
MAVTSAQIVDFLVANPGMTDAQIVSAMEQYGVSPAQMASAVGLDEGAVAARVGATVAPGMSVTLGDTVVTPQYQYIQSGEDNQVGALETVFTSKTTGDPNYKAPVGTPIQIYSATGDFINTVKTKKDLSFFGGIVDALKDPYVQAAILGATAGASGLFSGAGTAATVGTTGLTMAELAQLDLALGGAGGTAGATSLATALTTGAAVPTLTNLTGGSGVGTLGVTGANGAFLGEGVLSGVPAFDAALATAPTAFELANAGAGAFTPTFVPSVTTPGLLTPPVVPSTVTPPVAPPTVTPPVVPPVVPPTTVPPVVPPIVPPTGVPPIVPPIGAPTIPDITKLVQSGLTAAQIAALFSTTAQTAGGLLQQQTSREAAQKAQAMIDAETAAAKQSAAFRPIGMTTRFGASQFGFDPKTGQLTSAGYTLSPEAKAAQDRFVKLAEQGIQQAEGAQKAFEPLQTGAQSLFKLGQGYLAEKPEDVAKNYLASQMALLQPGRELELANLQNRLQQQGRGGLAVAQGGTMGATTPELQALYNARAQQEAQLAANAQQYGQQNVLFGAGLLGQGSQAMGQYYSGQQAAYAPYTTALGQVQALETAAQQPLTIGASLGQQSSAAGARAGALGLEGANISQRLATGAAATNNPYASLLSGAASNPAFNQLISGLFSSTPAITAMSAPATTFGTGSYYGNQDLGLFL